MREIHTSIYEKSLICDNSFNSLSKIGVFVTSQKNSKALFGIFALVFVFFVLLMIFAFFTMSAFKESADLDVKGKGQVAVIEINGVIMDSKNTVELLQKAEEDSGIKAIILRIDSPGGAVGPTQEIYEEIRRIDVKKPIYSSFGSIAASGGYYIGAATREIWANPGTLTGSIGVIMQFMDLSKLYEFAKVNQVNIKAGRYKDAGNPNRPLTEEEMHLMDTMIAGVHKQFVTDIMKVREKRIKGNIEELAQGQIFSGEEAFNNGLVDKLGSVWSLGREIHKKMKLSGEPAFIYLKKKKNSNFFELLENVEESISKLDLGNLSKMHSTPTLMFK